MKLKISGFFFYLIFFNSFSQSVENTKINNFFDPLKNKNHWGINTQFAFDRLFESRTTPIEILYKKQKSANKANRFGIQLLYDHSDERPYTSNPDWHTIDTEIVFGFFIGKEWQNFIGASQRWQWYYGLDINPSFKYNRQYINDGDPTDLRDYDDFNYYKYSISVKPLLGIRFEITPLIYVSTDMLIDARYTFEKATVELKQIPNVFPTYNHYTFDSNYSNLKYYPLTRLSVFIKL